MYAAFFVKEKLVKGVLPYSQLREMLRIGQDW